jgi:exopolysaccharide biosynthesis polyprenyl glycosylphosphotransferase
MMAVLALVEVSAIFTALCAVIFVWYRPALHGSLEIATALGVVAALALNVVSSLYYTDCYERRVVPGLRRFLARLPRCVAVAVLPLAAWHVLNPDTRIALITTGAAMLLVLPAVRAGFYRLLVAQPFVKRVLIVGSSPQAHKVAEAIEEEGIGRYVIVGVAEDGADADLPLARYPLLGPLHHLDKIIEATRPDRIVVALEDRRGRLPVPPLLDARLNNIVVEEGAELYERLTGKIAMESLTPSSLIFSPAFRPAPVAVAVGRLVSVIAAAIGLVALSPLLGLIALVIRAESAGPIFFVQERVGRAGRRFRLLKFRTMHLTSIETSEWARDNTERITRVGYWLRRFRLDELPQFVNILKGDMDLVGPRPHPVTNFSLFVTVLRNFPECGEQIPYYSLRSMVRPGITGWAQVRYRYANNLEEEIEKMRYDLYYVKHRSLWLDCRILAATVKTVLSGQGSVDVEPHPSTVTLEPEPEPAWKLVTKPR